MPTKLIYVFLSLFLVYSEIFFLANTCHVFNYTQIIFSKTGNLIYYIILKEEGGQAHDCGEGNSESGLVE